MRISTFIYVLLITGFLVTGFYTVLNDLADPQEGYNVVIDDQYTDAFDQVDNISTEINYQYNKMQNFTASKIPTLGFITLTIDAMILLKDFIVLPFTVIGVVIGGVMEYMKLPSWVTGFFLAIVTAALLFGMLSIFKRFRYI